MQASRSDGKPTKPPVLGPLPPGRHQYTPEQVAYHQRERLIAGLAATVAERGYAATTVRQVAAAAHVSRRVFYEHFESKEECFVAAFDAVIAHLRSLMRAAIEPLAGDWPRQLVAAARVGLDFFAAEPDLARFCLHEALSVGPAMQRRGTEIVHEFAPFMAIGREGSAGGAEELAVSTDVALLGAVANRLTREVATNGPAGLPARLPELVEFLLTPYVGVEPARALAREAVDDQSGPGVSE